MIFLTPKTKVNKKGIVLLEDLIKALKQLGFIQKSDISDALYEVKESIRDLLIRVEEVSSLKHIEDLIVKKGVLDMGTPANIAYPPTIEKKDISNGTIYYDVLNDRLRLKKSTGWTTVKLD